MKVLSKPNSSFIRICTGNRYGGCGAVLDIETSDLRYWPGISSGSMGDSDPAVAFKCILCNTVTAISRGRWPQQYANLKTATTKWYSNIPEIEDIDDKY